MWFYIGLLTVVINGVILILIPPTLYKFIKSFKEGTMDVGNGFLIVSIILGQPVALYENLMYIDLTLFSIPLVYNLTLLKITFGLATIAIICYNLQLLTMKGLPDWPVSFLMVTMGFASGAMVIGLQLNPLAAIPIYYFPIFAGLIFIGGLMLFNLVGMIGFMLALNEMRYVKDSLISWWHIMAAFLFFIGPIIVFGTRIYHVMEVPLNLLFFPFLLAFVIEMVLFLLGRDGYPILGTINSIALLDKEKQVVLGGFHKRGNIELVKLSGMAMLATETVLQELVMGAINQDSKLAFGYGNIIFLEKYPLLLLINLEGDGSKIARLIGILLLRRLKKRYCVDQDEFQVILKRFFHSFFLYEKPHPNSFFYMLPTG